VVIGDRAASRPYLPFEGRAWIRVELDGMDLSGSRPIDSPGLNMTTIAPAPTRLTPGEHVLKVLLLDGSTTTYQIRELRVERGL